MGPLSGVKIVEFAGIGPGPFAAMMLADMGADVTCIERIGGGMFNMVPHFDFANRNKRSLALNLKSSEGVAIARKLVAGADAILEGFRPGVMEKFGLGPEDCLSLNPKLVYGRVTGWGQTGPLAQRAGHDIDYIAMAGCLFPIGRKGHKPTIPLNIIGDFAGGAQLAAYGIVCALFESARSGKGQVVDAAMIDGAAQLYGMMFASQQIGFWSEERGTNVLDGGAHFYEVYETSDGQFVAVGAVETQFYAQLLDKLGLAGETLPDQWDKSNWENMKLRFSNIFSQRTRDEWCKIFAGSDACFAPVLSLAEAMNHPDNLAREMFLDIDGARHPAPAPRFSRTPGAIRHGAVKNGTDSRSILLALGYQDADLDQWLQQGVIATA